MITLTVSKDIAPWDKDVEVYITKNIIEEEWWLLLYKCLGCKVYFIYGPTDSNYIHPIWSKLYFKFVEELVGTEPYTKCMLEYFNESKIILDTFQIEIVN